MKKIFFLFVTILLIHTMGRGQVKVENLLCENLVNPIGLDILNPRFSWQLLSDHRNVIQSAYEIRMGSDSAALVKGKKLIWSSTQTTSEASVHVAYDGPAIEAEEKYYWQVRVWDNKGAVSDWSAPAHWQVGLLNTSDWLARWIQPGYLEDSIERPSPLFRKEFTVSKKIKSATLYITAHGLYEANINGSRIGNSYLTPGWTSYQNRLLYQTYDLTNQIRKGANAIGITLGSGWYRGYIGFSNKKDFYGGDISLLFQLAIRYTDGSKELIKSDSSWKSSTGEILHSEIYNGESIDLRLSKAGWMNPGYDDSRWSGVRTMDFKMTNLLASGNEPIRMHETFAPIRIFKTPKGEQVIDFGQNLVGWVVFQATGKSGDHITLKHAEVLDKKGNFYTDNLRFAKAEDSYILSGEETAELEPHFTFHGFRYVKIEGYPGELKAENFKAVALYSDMEATGNFTSSNQLINQLQHNIQWGQKGNFLDVPTDCPQRDERLGWTGDAQVFSRTASFNMNVNSFFAKWLRDLAADQNSNGIVPFVIPDVLLAPVGSAGWADAATIIPWNMYLAYGDLKILQDQYASMKAWVDYMSRSAKNDLWNTGFHFGDWLFYRPEDDNDGRAAVTDKYLIAQCFYAHSTQILISAAQTLGKTDDVGEYSNLLQKIKTAFLKEYVTPSGRLVSGTQTAYVLALQFDMLPENLRTQAASRLADNIRSYDMHLTTGFLGTPYICHVLSRYGYSDIAYKLLLQETYPSWLYPVKMGATTIWERWDGIKPDSSFETPSMNSFNHYSYGAIGDWMYRVIAGIDTYEDGPGYKHIRIMPHPGGGLSYATATLKTYYGSLGSSWKIDQNNLQLDIEIPANTRATVYIPARSIEDISESGKTLSMSKDIQLLGEENNFVQVALGSGFYHFNSGSWNSDR
jgi:alpha-L-rhamnosidase